jgi:hypothetical protein
MEPSRLSRGLGLLSGGCRQESGGRGFLAHSGLASPIPSNHAPPSLRSEFVDLGYTKYRFTISTLSDLDLRLRIPAASVVPICQ